MVECIVNMIEKNSRLQKIFEGNIPKLETIDAQNKEKYAHNCENILGFVPLPVGIAGPLLIDGKYASGAYKIPLGTTEACLVASVHRGAKAIARADGCTTNVHHVGISRAPVFLVENPLTAEEYAQKMDPFFDAMNESLKKISQHTRLLRYEIVCEKKYVYVRLWFATGEAMGMNMATIATKHLADNFLENIVDGTLIATSSNWCSDKKACTSHTENGRKYSVDATVFLDAENLAALHVTAETLMHVYAAKIVGGSVLAGALCANAHHANIVAAFFAATGQDLAHTVEGSLGFTKMEAKNNGIEVHVHLPAIVCGTIGGGTKLPVQRQFINVIGLQHAPGEGSQSMEMAEVLAAGVLAGEISLLCAIAQQRLAKAHDDFRR